MTNETTNKELRAYISQAEAARIIGTTKQTVTNLVREGRFTTRSVAGRTLVRRSEAESFVARPKGRPTKEVPVTKDPLKKPPKNRGEEDAAKYISQAEAARIRDVSQSAIANLIRRGRLTTLRAAGRTVVLRSEVEAFVPKPRTGRPPKKRAGEKAPNRSYN